MKLKLFAIIIIFILSCTKETPCDCNRINYRSLQFTGCEPDPTDEKSCLGFTTEDTIFNVGCELEQGKIKIDGTTNKWYEIKCNYK